MSIATFHSDGESEKGQMRALVLYVSQAEQSRDYVHTVMQGDSLRHQPLGHTIKRNDQAGNKNVILAHKI